MTAAATPASPASPPGRAAGAIHTPRPSRAAPWRQRDLTRALRAAVSAGMQVVGTRIERDGAFVLIYAGAEGVASPRGALDQWREGRRAG
jgi:hypothetical protein